MPREITVDNGKQFDSDAFKDYCHSIGTKVHFTSAYHPQSNELVERANGLIFLAIKKQLLDSRKGKWIDRLPKVVCALNTSESRSTKYNPFKLMYGAKAMTPEKVKHRGPRTLEGAIQEPNEASCKDLVEIDKLQAVHNIEKYQRETHAWRDKKVVTRAFESGDLVLLRTLRTKGSGKLETKWRGPYIMTKCNRSGAYRLTDAEGNDLRYSYNAENLRKFYI